MNPVPASVKAPKLPQVNLIPPEVGQRRVRGRQRLIALALLLVFIAAVGAGAFLITGAKIAAERELADAEALHAKLLSEAESYAEVPIVEAELANARDARAYAAATEMIHSDLYEYLDAALPDDLVIESISVAKVSLTSVTAVDAGPFSKPDVGVMTFVARTTTAVEAAELIEELSRVPYFARIRISTTTRTAEDAASELGESGTSVYFSVEGTVRLTYDALSGRFAPDVDELAPQPSPSPEPDASPSPTAGQE